MSEFKSIEARIHALNSLEMYAGKRPEITEDIKRLNERRKKLRAAEVQKPKEVDADAPIDGGTIPSDDRSEAEGQ